MKLTVVTCALGALGIAPVLHALKTEPSSSLSQQAAVSERNELERDAAKLKEELAAVRNELESIRQEMRGSGTPAERKEGTAKKQGKRIDAAGSNVFHIHVEQGDVHIHTGGDSALTMSGGTSDTEAKPEPKASTVPDPFTSLDSGTRGGSMFELMINGQEITMDNLDALLDSAGAEFGQKAMQSILSGLDLDFGFDVDIDFDEEAGRFSAQAQRETRKRTQPKSSGSQSRRLRLSGGQTSAPQGGAEETMMELARKIQADVAAMRSELKEVKTEVRRGSQR